MSKRVGRRLRAVGDALVHRGVEQLRARHRRRRRDASASTAAPRSPPSSARSSRCRCSIGLVNVALWAQKRFFPRPTLEAHRRARAVRSRDMNADSTDEHPVSLRRELRAQPDGRGARAQAASASASRVQSAGSEPSRVNPYAIEVMREVGVDLATHTLEVGGDHRPGHASTPSSRSAPRRSARSSSATARRLHWPIQDPASDDPSLSREEMLARFRTARDQIQGRLEVLAALLDVPEGPRADEFHASVRVKDLAEEHALLRVAPRRRAEGVDASLRDVRPPRAAHELRAGRLRRQGAAPRHALPPRHRRRRQGRGHRAPTSWRAPRAAR